MLDSKNRSLLHRINQVSFFDGFSHIEKGKLLEKVEMFKKYEKKGWTIFSEGAKGESMYVVLEGVIGITRLTFKHDKKKTSYPRKIKERICFRRNFIAQQSKQNNWRHYRLIPSYCHGNRQKNIRKF